MRRPTTTAPRILLSGLLAALLATAAVLVPSAPAAALDPGTVVVPAGHRVGPVLVVRPTRVDVALDGRVLRAVRHPGTVDLADLPALVGDSRFVRRPSPSAVRLLATVVVRPGATVVGGGPRLARLTLGPGGIETSRAALDLHGVAVVAGGADRAGLVARRSRVVLRDVSLRGLGSAAAVRPGPALRLSGGIVSLTRVTVTGGGPGVELSAPEHAVVSGLALTRTGGDGLVVTGPAPDVRLDGVRATEVAGTGVRLRAVARLGLDGVTTTSSRETGVELSGTTGVELSGLVSDGDGTGVKVTGGSATTLGDPVVRNAGTGLRLLGPTDVVGGSVSAGSDGVVVDRAAHVALSGLTVAARRDAVRVADGAADVRLDRVSLTSSGADGAALRVSGVDVRVTGSALTGASGAVARGGADRVGLSATSVTASGPALDLGTGTGTVSVTGGTLTSAGRSAVLADGRRLALDGTRVDGGERGLDVSGVLEAHRVAVTSDGVGVRVARSATARLESSSVTAGTVGVAASVGAGARMVETAVSAPDPATGPVRFVGFNRWSHLPLRWMGLVAVVVAGLAVGLELLRRFREHDAAAHGTAPEHVLNFR